MSKPRITQIPFPGSSEQTPTGAMQFQDDWPGLFLRGDDAIMLEGAINDLAERLGDSEDAIVESALSKLQELAEIIARDVVWRDGAK